MGVFIRNEKKFLITKSQMNKILEFLKDEIQVDKFMNEDGEHVYSIYYDTVEDTIIRNSIEHPIYKDKLRVRSYKLNPEGSDKVFLEIKKKMDGEGSKRRISVTMSELSRIVEKKEKIDLGSILDNQIEDEILNFLKINKVKPKLFMDVHRIAYFKKDDPSFRITFDDSVNYRKSSINFIMDTGKPLLKEDEVIMEVKFKNSIPFELSRFLSEEGIYKTRFSKYGRIYEKEQRIKFLGE